jgi:hypothetical protein
MKKSFLYVLSAALLLTLSLSGCPQDADDDDDGASTSKPADPGNPPTSDLSYIAYAFGQSDGPATVKAVNNIRLGDNELVIPAGKTLDLASEGVILKGFTKNSKIIAWGDGKINFSSAQKSVQLPTGALIIADEEFINANVKVEYFAKSDGIQYQQTAWDTNGIPDPDRPTAGDTAPFRVFWDQIVIIKTFEDFKGYTKPATAPAETAPLNGRGYKFQDKYVAVKAPENGEITSDEVGEINKKAQDLCFYLAGEPVIFSFPNEKIELKKDVVDSNEYYKKWEPNSTAIITTSSVFNYIDNSGAADRKGSLVVAGDIDFRHGTVKAPGGLTVWGVLKNSQRNDTSTDNITDDETPFTAWTVRLNGATFNDDVTLLGSVANTFGGAANFSGKTRITGSSTFNGATFGELAVFSGPVTFNGTKGGASASVKFEGDVVFADNVFINAKVSFDPNKDNRFYKLLGGLSFDELAKYKLKPGDNDTTILISEKNISPPDDAASMTSVNFVFTEDVIFKNGTYHFPKKVTFENSLTTSAGSLSFAETPEFKGTVTGGGSITVTGTDKVTFAKTVNIGYGKFNVDVTFAEDVTFTESVEFAKAVNGTGNLNTPGSAKFGGTVSLVNADFGGPVSFTKTGEPIKINGNVTFGSYASLLNDEVEFGNATFKKSGSLGAKGGKINTAQFDAYADAKFISSGNLILTGAGITLPGKGTISATADGSVVKFSGNGIDITGRGSIGPAIVFNSKGLTLSGEDAGLTLIGGGNKYIDFVKASDSGAGGFDITGGVGTLTFGSFSANDGDSTPTITLKSNSEFLIDSEFATSYAVTGGSFTLYNTILDLSGGSVTFGGTKDMLIVAGGGNLKAHADSEESGSGSVLNSTDFGAKKMGIVITAGNGTDPVIVSGTLSSAGETHVMAGSVGTLTTKYITNASSFSGTLITGDKANAGSTTAVTAAAAGTNTTAGSIAVYAAIE